MNQYYKEGYIAYQEGKTLREYPTYLTPSTLGRWQSGWWDAAEDAAEEKNYQARKEFERKVQAILGCTEEELTLLKRYFKS